MYIYIYIYTYIHRYRSFIGQAARGRVRVAIGRGLSRIGHVRL